MLFDENNRAIGVEYLHGERLYRASAHPSEEPGELRQIHASKEVILAGGTFNTPQLLMLSGIGPREVLERHGIKVRVELSGVGKNLQDRYEVACGEPNEFSGVAHVQGYSIFTRRPAIQTMGGMPFRDLLDKRFGNFHTQTFCRGGRPS